MTLMLKKIEELKDNLSMAIASVVNILDPDVLFLVVAYLMKLILTKFNQKLENLLLEMNLRAF